MQGEDDKHEITAGSLVTVKVTLIRSPLLDPNERAEERNLTNEAKIEAEQNDEEEAAAVDQNDENEVIVVSI